MARDFARQLRHNMTKAEHLMWRCLRNRQVSGCKFRRQHPLGKYVVDFVCLEKMIVVELDGSQHFDQAEYDQERTSWLNEKGFNVIRFWNNDVIYRTDDVLNRIFNVLTDVE